MLYSAPMHGDSETGALQGAPRVGVLSTRRALAGAIARYLARQGFIATFTTSESRVAEQRGSFDVLLLDLPEDGEGPSLDWRAVLWPAAAASEVRVAAGRAPVAFYQKPVSWEAVARGLSSLGSAVTAPVGTAGPGAPRAQAAALEKPLSARERETLGHLVSGLGNKQIAERMGVSEPTVKKHVQHLVAKLGAADRTHAAVRAVRQGLV